MGMSRADNSKKIWWNLPISNPKPDIQNINAHTKFGVFSSYHPETENGWTDGRMDERLMDGQTDEHTDVQC